MKYIILFALSITIVTSLSLNGCQECQLYNNCSTAYIGHPGQFCGNWTPAYDLTLPCCCPIHSKCLNYAHTCRCDYVDPNILSEKTIICIFIVGITCIAFGIMIWIRSDSTPTRTNYSNNYTYNPIFYNDNSNDTSFSGDW